jgi:hypothetical protein
MRSPVANDGSPGPSLEGGASPSGLTDQAVRWESLRDAYVERFGALFDARVVNDDPGECSGGASHDINSGGWSVQRTW